MRFGATYQIQKDTNSNITKTHVKKVRDHTEFVNETVVEERIQIIKIQDFDTLVSQLHIDHALQDHGAWIEYANGKMYAVLGWIERDSIDL
jgi:carbonic anhydrase